ncbi:MAG: hypothetical protein LLF94_10910 [Chlamydiales bacterium]|nr:hypothetical protein [Chlamydiales bacterium]
MFRFFPYLFCALFAVSCVPQEAPEPEKTQLEIREFQTRTFDVDNYSGVMKSILDVLQDDGFMVKNVSADLGFLSATKDIGLNSPIASDDGFDFDFSIGSGMGVGVQRRFPGRQRAYPTHESVEATINVSQFGQKVRVRASFQSKIFDSNHAIMRVHPIEDEQFYQDFFLKVDKGIFIQQQHI